MTSTIPGRSSRAFVLALLLVAASTIGLAWRAAAAHAVSDPNDIQCAGHISAGKPEVGITDQQVKYVFGCDTPITGYQISTDSSVTGFDDSTIATGGDGQPVPSDGFTCNGDFPGIAFNCIGVYGATIINNKYESVSGEFSISTKLCAEPRVDPLLTVVANTVTQAVPATKTTAAVPATATQYISGPFDLGRPLGCPKSALSGNARIGPDGSPVDKAQSIADARAAAKAKAKKKAKEAAEKKHHHKKHNTKKH